jgi:hypothetical protein
MGLLTGYDAIGANWTLIPTDAQYVFLYNDGDYAAPAAAYTTFQERGVTVATVCAYPTTVANVLDVETGNIVTPADPAGAIEWAQMMRADYDYPGVIYCNASSQNQVAAAFASAGVAQPLWSLAQWTGTAPSVMPADNVVNVQWASEQYYDRDAVSSAFPQIGPKVGAGGGSTSPANVDMESDMIILTVVPESGADQYWALSGGLLWQIADANSLAGYQHAGGTPPTLVGLGNGYNVSAAELEAIQAAIAARTPTGTSVSASSIAADVVSDLGAALSAQAGSD